MQVCAELSHTDAKPLAARTQAQLSDERKRIAAPLLARWRCGALSTAQGCGHPVNGWQQQKEAWYIIKEYSFCHTVCMIESRLDRNMQQETGSSCSTYQLVGSQGMYICR